MQLRYSKRMSVTAILSACLILVTPPPVLASEWGTMGQKDHISRVGLEAEWSQLPHNGRVAARAGSASVKRTTVRRGAAGKRAAVRRPTVNRNTNINVRRTNVNVVNRPVRVWSVRPHYGTIVAGVALGTLIAVSAANAAPAPPAPNLCWYWSDPSRTQGYWDYC